MAFEGFQLSYLDLPEIRVRVRHGGSGPPLLLLHGCPQTHMMWGRIAGDLARDFTVVAPDLRGYGETSKPPGAVDGEAYSKRAMARDAVALMDHFGFPTFDVAGHDRGGRVAYRLALDHPRAVRRLCVLDIIPTGEVWANAPHNFTQGYWQWSFLAQPAPLPERIIAQAPEQFFLNALFGGDAGWIDAEALADYMRCLRDPETVRGICEDYRAGAGFDRTLDQAQMGKARIACPVKVLWSAKGGVGAWYDALEVWGRWADHVSGEAFDCGHYLPEQRPAETLRALRGFFAEGR